jgi:hypothetical protein
MPEIAWMFWLGLALVVVALLLLIYRATRPAAIAEDDPWYIRILRVLVDAIGPGGVIGFLLLAAGIGLMAWGWDPEMVRSWIPGGSPAPST